MEFQIGDKVKVPLAKSSLSDPDEYVYGVITDKQGRGKIAVVKLAKPNGRVKYMSTMMYLVSAVSTLERFTYFNDGEPPPVPKCRHVWEKSGQGIHMKVGEYWYNCVYCKIPKESV